MKRTVRLFCLLAYRLVAMHLPHSFWPGGVLFSTLRRYFLIGMGCRVGQECELEPGIDVGFRPDLSIGNHCQINQNTSIKSARIGNDVMIAPGVVLLDRQHNFSRIDIPMTQQGASLRQLTVIGDDVWLGQNVIVMPGITIGSGVIVGAGSVVTRDLPDWSVAVGVPAKVIRYRKDAK
ncbi:acyltransferase [Sterolibacterium denitrificans]|uniref:acyltransferase n=1 Tax=Sterolibacterium denitrificans TaxID=157592 RepID=UPI0018D557B7|nr:acyltransferase [Sterolibacterium denitrificans]